MDQTAPETPSLPANSGSIKQLLTVCQLSLDATIAVVPESPLLTWAGLWPAVLDGPLPTTSPERCSTLCRFTL